MAQTVAACAAVWALTLGAGAALAQKADRDQPIQLESDKPCVVQLNKRSSQCSGNVLVTQGSFQLRADRLEVQDTTEGYPRMQAQGSAAQPARVKQKRDGLDETVEGQAQRIAYDSRSGVLRFEGAAILKRLVAGRMADEVQGAQIVWDSRAETFQVEGGQASSANPGGGRARAVIIPRAAGGSGTAAPSGDKP